MNRRQSNFELLRIVLMLLIVMIHAIAHGFNINGGLAAEKITFEHNLVGTTNYLLLQLLLCCSMPAVNCFVLMTGYFTCSITEFKLDKIIRIWKQTAFYSIFIGIFAYATGLQQFSLKEFILCFFPVIRNSYWFVTCYLAVVALMPFLSMMLQKLDKRQFEILLLILLILNFNPYNWTYGCFNEHGYDVMWFVFLALTGAYIRVYNPLERLKKHWGKLFFTFAFILSAFISYKFKYHNPYELRNSFIIEYNGYTYFLSITMFMFFKNLRLSDNVLTNFFVKIAPYSFAVYLIHDNGMLRYHIWEDWFYIGHYSQTIWCIPNMLTHIIIIYVICSTIDYCRSKLLSLSVYILRKKECY